LAICPIIIIYEKYKPTIFVCFLTSSSPWAWDPNANLRGNICVKMRADLGVNFPLHFSLLHLQGLTSGISWIRSILPRNSSKGKHQFRIKIESLLRVYMIVSSPSISSSCSPPTGDRVRPPLHMQRCASSTSLAPQTLANDWFSLTAASESLTGNRKGPGAAVAHRDFSELILLRCERIWQN